MPGRPPIDKDRIRQLAAQGVQPKAIAERLGVSRTVVSKELKRAKR